MLAWRRNVEHCVRTTPFWTVPTVTHRRLVLRAFHPLSQRLLPLSSTSARTSYASLSLFLFQYLFVSFPLDPLLSLIHLPSFAWDTTIYADTEFLTSLPSYPTSPARLFLRLLFILALSSNTNPSSNYPLNSPHPAQTRHPFYPTEVNSTSYCTSSSGFSSKLILFLLRQFPLWLSRPLWTSPSAYLRWTSNFVHFLHVDATPFRPRLILSPLTNLPLCPSDPYSSFRFVSNTFTDIFFFFFLLRRFGFLIFFLFSASPFFFYQWLLEYCRFGRDIF